MACCVALTLIFAWTYRVLRWFGLGSSDDEFAPAASWPPVERPASAPPARNPYASLGQALIVVGIAWFVAGMLAMHVFGLLPHIQSVPADIAFHGSGLWLATAGLALRFLHRPTLHRPTLGTAL
jgi:hypothetical protein